MTLYNYFAKKTKLGSSKIRPQPREKRGGTNIIQVSLMADRENVQALFWMIQEWAVCPVLNNFNKIKNFGPSQKTN